MSLLVVYIQALTFAANFPHYNEEVHAFGGSHEDPETSTAVVFVLRGFVLLLFHARRSKHFIRRTHINLFAVGSHGKPDAHAAPGTNQTL